MNRKPIKYQLVCPTCGTRFNVESQLEVWKEELILEIDKLVRRMRGLKK